MPMNQPMKPFQFCENYLITRFLNGVFSCQTPDYPLNVSWLPKLVLHAQLYVKPYNP